MEQGNALDLGVGKGLVQVVLRAVGGACRHDCRWEVEPKVSA